MPKEYDHLLAPWHYQRHDHSKQKPQMNNGNSETNRNKIPSHWILLFPPCVAHPAKNGRELEDSNGGDPFPNHHALWSNVLWRGLPQDHTKSNKHSSDAYTSFKVHRIENDLWNFFHKNGVLKIGCIHDSDMQETPIWISDPPPNKGNPKRRTFWASQKRHDSQGCCHG